MSSEKILFFSNGIILLNIFVKGIIKLKKKKNTYGAKETKK
jgi:hypothetical protein